MTKRWGASSNALSKTTIGLLPLRQLPVIFISSIVCALSTWNRIEGPFGALAAQRYRSPYFRRASKKRALLQLARSQSSLMSGSWCFESSFASAGRG